MEQLSFLHQLVKMLLNGSKWHFSSTYLRNKKIIFIFLTGPPAPRLAQLRFTSPGPRRGRSRMRTHRAHLPRLPGRHTASVHRRRRAVLRPVLGSRADQTRAPPHTPLTCCLVPLPLAQQQHATAVCHRTRPLPHRSWLVRPLKLAVDRSISP